MPARDSSGAGLPASPRRQSQRGFAMLLVFLMAAVIAISLYMEVPRVAFESQRQKEQLLIERGEQYKRAIKVFFNTNKRWPAKLEDLENLNGRRYLRKRYIDPMTGKDEWRPIHIVNGILTDSKVTKAPGAGGEKDKTAGQYITEMAGIGQTPTGTTGGTNLANRRRDSDSLNPGVTGGAPGMSGDTSQLQPGQQQPYPQGMQPGMQPGMVPGGMPGVTGATGPIMPGQIAPGVPFPQGRLPGNIPGATGAPGAQPAQSGGYITASGYIGQPPATPQQQFPGQPVNSQTQSPYQTNPQQLSPELQQGGDFAGRTQPGSSIPNQSDAARNMISGILYGPRPGPPGVVAGGQVMGSGIAGFASTAEAEGIMVYKDRTNYSEWEFVFDPSKDSQQFNPNQSNIGQQPKGPGSPQQPTSPPPAAPR